MASEFVTYNKVLLSFENPDDNSRQTERCIFSVTIAGSGASCFDGAQMEMTAYLT